MIWMVLSGKEPNAANDYLVRAYNNEAAASRHASEIGGRVEATELDIEGPIHSDYEEAPVVTHDLERKTADKAQQ